MSPTSATPPVGVVAMLFTDIEGSTALVTRLGAAWPRVLGEHHQILQEAIASGGGYVDRTEGDAFFATFSDPGAAVQAAVRAQRELRAHTWPDPLRVRMGLHVGFVEHGPTGYVGLEVHRAARVGAAAHGGQLILTAAVREIVGGELESDYLGAFRLKDFPAAVQLYCAVIDGRGASEFPPPRTLDARPTNLPAGLPMLVGRDHELEAIRHALCEGGDRLLTLTGQGGSGKTSLALVAAAAMLDEHPGGVWWVDLSQVTRAERLLDAVASAIGADREVQASALDATTARLREAGHALLLLDNLEHLADAWHEVGRLFDAVPDVHVLCTSRMSLRLRGERVIPLDALDGASALTLIGRVVQRRGGSWSPTPADEQALLDVVELVDGLPLALELAAARLVLLTPQQLGDRLRTSMDLLIDPSRPERQRSLTSIVNWTLNLLDEAPRRLFARMAAFGGPVELDEVELVTGGDGLDVLEALATLLDAALVHRVERGDGKIRFGLPEALRQIAARKLDASHDAGRWRQAHAERQLDLLRVHKVGRASEVDGAKGALPEARAAVRWSSKMRHPLASELNVRLGAWSMAAGRLREGAEVLAPLIESPPNSASLRSLVYRSQAHLVSMVGDLEDALRLLELALANADDDLSVLECVLQRGVTQLLSGRLELAVADHRRATRMARSLDQAALAAALILEAQAMTATGDVAAATALLNEARRVGEPVQASGLAAIDTVQADLAMAASRPADALEPYSRSLEAAQRQDDPLQILFDLWGMANALGALGRDEEALEVLGLADMQGQDVGGKTDIAEQMQGSASVRAALARLDPEQAEAARARGCSVVPGRRVARACELGRSVVRA